MSWFGRGKGTDEAVPEKTDLPSYEEPPSYTPPPGGGMPSSSGGASPEAIQAAVMQEQQKALVQQVIAKLTEVSFDQCIDRPEASLTSRQRTCIHAVVGKYLDTSEFVIGRATKGAQQ
mmetsp:Transcript_9588/g.31309  ORF Transcript_9588/g.31309 Transcript_9588/m.31309 type:complete len:118 (-) Transcript_9588:132-485(-)